MAMKRTNLPVSALEIFENEFFGQIRYFRPEPDFDPWFVAVDVCRALEIQNPRDAVSRLDDDEKMTVGLTDGQKMTLTISKGHSGKRGGAQFITFVSEPGLYRLIMSSRKPEAKKFQRWVFHEVLPSIRRYGYYIAPYQKIIEIKGTENLEAFKAKYPADAVEVKATFLDADEDEYGVEGMAYLRYKVVLHSNKLIGGEQGRKLSAS